MHRRLSLATGALLLMLAVTSGLHSFADVISPGSSSNHAAQVVTAAPQHTEPATAATAPGIVLIELQPAALLGQNELDRNIDTLALQRILGSAGVLDIEPVFQGITVSQSAETRAIDDLLRIYRLRLVPGIDYEQALRSLRALPIIAYAEPDHQARISSTPNDPRYADAWALAKIGSPAAWDVTTGDPDVAVAVIDSGIDLAHSDLSGQLWTNPGEIAANGIDDDNNGQIPLANSWKAFGSSGIMGHADQPREVRLFKPEEPMSLKPSPIAVRPEDTARIARAAFPNGTPYLILRDQLGVIFTDQDFTDLFPQRGQSAFGSICWDWN
jgi:subtilisin family serine protease